MHKPLAGRKIAILVGNGFDEIQMTDCQRALLGAGATVKIVSPASGLVNGWQGKSWGHYYPVDQHVAQTLAADFDMLVLPGGERSVTKLLETAHTVRIIRGFRDADKPVAAIGTGVDLIAAADRLTGMTVSANASSHEALQAAGAQFAETSMNTDGRLFTATDEAVLAEMVQSIVSFFAGGEALEHAA